MRAAAAAARVRAARCAPPLLLRPRGPRPYATHAAASPSTAAAPPADDGYETLSAAHTVETEVKKSRFIALAAPAASGAEALAFVKRSADAGARHNCWAYRVGADFRCSDDGEPGGTAGRPILNAIEGAGLDATVVLVTRWFGGIKLGAGGLTRGACRVRAASVAFGVACERSRSVRRCPPAHACACVGPSARCVLCS
jgi:hypothetical protein